jgi:hypothetical protein
MKKNLNLIIAAVFMMGFLMFWQSFVMSRYSTAPKPAAAIASSTASSSVEHGSLTPTELSSLAQTPNPAKETLTILETPNVLQSGWRYFACIEYRLGNRCHAQEFEIPEFRCRHIRHL